MPRAETDDSGLNSVRVALLGHWSRVCCSISPMSFLRDPSQMGKKRVAGGWRRTFAGQDCVRLFHVAKQEGCFILVLLNHGSRDGHFLASLIWGELPQGVSLKDDQELRG
jgi:hypothetical protein